MRIVSFSACTDWYCHTVDNAAGISKLTLIAGWAVTDDGEVKGMVAGYSGKLEFPSDSGKPTYKHLSDLTAHQRAEIKR